MLQPTETTGPSNVCRVCGRGLKDIDSIARGMGPVCARKAGYTSMETDEPQLDQLDLTTPPFEGNVSLYRDANGTAQANIPWSVISHSPTGFEWGYGGSGPADLALNILNAFVPPGSDGEEPVECFQGAASRTAWDLHQRFKWKFIGGIENEGGVISAADIKRFIRSEVEG